MGTVTDVFIGVCPEAHEVYEYPGPGGRPRRRVCSKCGMNYTLFCPNDRCPDRWYRHEDYRSNYHGCGEQIPWAHPRDQIIEATPIYVAPQTFTPTTQIELTAEERQNLIVPPSERTPKTRVVPVPARQAPEAFTGRPERAAGAPAAPDLNAEQRRFLQVTFDSFIARSAWPDVDDLQREIDLRDEALELEKIGETVPDRLARFVWEGGRLVKLKVRGMTHCKGVDAELDQFMTAVRFFVQKYLSRERVTMDELRKALSDPDAGALRRTYLMLEFEGHFLGGGSGGVDDEWHRDVSNSARQFRKVRSLDEYIAMVEKLERERGPLVPLLERAVEAHARLLGPTSAAARPLPAVAALRPAPRSRERRYDVFIAHAHEDKEAAAGPIAAALRERGLQVWYDDYELRLGDSLHRRIDEGLRSCRFGVVILSPNFFQKEWPQKELDGLVQRESDGTQVVLPVWHLVGRDEVAKRSLLLADRVAVRTSEGIDAVVHEIIDVLDRHADAGG